VILLNERDYLIGEAMVISTGAFVTMTIAVMMTLYHLPADINIIIALSFIGFMTFFFGLYLHMKRRIYVLENEALIQEHKGDKPEQ
jgi:predicted neutral ceramidase superfamily lipid hydrolase